MLTINYRQIYETNEAGEKQWVLILYDISANQYVGFPVYSKEKERCIFLKSVSKYADINNIRDYNRSKMIKCIYVYKKPLKLSNNEFSALVKSCKLSLINYMNDNIPSDIDGVSYLKWCRDKYNFNKEDIKLENLKQGGIYWINMGINIGSELRKLRPVVLWRSTADKKT